MVNFLCIKLHHFTKATNLLLSIAYLNEVLACEFFKEMDMINLREYLPKGDKKNSEYFNEYLQKIYSRRMESGLHQLLGNITAIMIQVESEDLLNYLHELYLMTPYRLKNSLINETHRITILQNPTPESPVLIVMAPKNRNYTDDFTRMNLMYPNSLIKPNSRYIGEIIHTQKLQDTLNILQSHNISFFTQSESKNALLHNKNFVLTRPSDLTGNCTGYSEIDFTEDLDHPWGKPCPLSSQEEGVLLKADELSKKHGFSKLILGIDHCATRILASDREDAILEYLCLSNYYYWGAYEIKEMNSSTNVTRTPHGHDLKSPAKVFTANNTPYMVNSFEQLPMPTEQFVKNYGRRMHHIAYEVLDGDYSPNLKNIDYVVQTLHRLKIEFLFHIFGECSDIPDLKQIFSKHSQLSLLITEYVERCHHFDGFFTKKNVAELTKAAGKDEEVLTHTQHKGVIGD